jgi:hypothetical protein
MAGRDRIPPSGHVAGVWCRTDAGYGVHRAGGKLSRIAADGEWNELAGAGNSRRRAGMHAHEPAQLAAQSKQTNKFAPSGIRTRATALKGPRPGPLVDGGGYLDSTLSSRVSEAPGPVAQLVEQGTFNPKVAGSIPARPTRKSSSRGGVVMSAYFEAEGKLERHFERRLVVVLGEEAWEREKRAGSTMTLEQSIALAQLLRDAPPSA